MHGQQRSLLHQLLQPSPLSDLSRGIASDSIVLFIVGYLVAFFGLVSGLATVNT